MKIAEIATITYTCNHCSKNDDTVHEHEVSGETVLICDDCFTSHCRSCEDCGEIFFKGDLRRTQSGEFICENCRDEYYYSCEHCGELIHQDYIYSHEDSVYCEDCFNDNFVQCCHCNETLRRGRHYENNYGDYYCSDCYHDNYTECDECQCEVHRDNIIYDESADYYYCERCYNENCRTIRNYSYKPSPIFYGKKTIDDLFFGIELEVENHDNNNSNNDTAEAIEKDYLYFKQDGSLNNGFEIVTHPMTFDYINNKADFKNMTKELKERGYRSYNTSSCGMHIHINKNIVSSLHLYKILAFFYNHPKQLFKISQRKIENLNQWAKLADSTNTPKNTLVKLAKEKGGHSYRYTAINLQNSRTIEFRLFRGTLNYNSFMKNIQFVHSLFHFTRDNGIEGITWDNFIQYIENKPMYRELFYFIKAKLI